MEHDPTDALDRYREACRSWRAFHEDHGTNRSHLHAELARIVLASLAATGSVALFNDVEADVQRHVLRDLRRYKRTGRLVTCTLPDARYRDVGAQARAAIDALAAAALVPLSMTRIATPLPVFMGLEHVRGAEALRARLPADDALLDVELVALAQDVPNPRAYPERWTMRLLLTEHARLMQTPDLCGEVYERIPVRSCVATFALYKYVSMVFWPRFCFGHVTRCRVVQVPGPRRGTRLQVKLDMGDKGRLHCRDMELIGLDDIDCWTEEPDGEGGAAP